MPKLLARAIIYGGIEADGECLGCGISRFSSIVSKQPSIVGRLEAESGQAKKKWTLEETSAHRLISVLWGLA